MFHHNEVSKPTTMKIAKQDLSLPVENLDFIEVTAPKKNGKLLPHSFRAAFLGPSGGGKTNALLTLLFSENGLKFENVYVYSKSLYQPKYQLLQDVLKQVKEVSYFPFSDNDDVIDIKDARENSVFIFDDVSSNSQVKIRDYYSMCRHKNIDAAYLCQTYSKIPKQLIRDNCNVIVLFKQDDVNLRHAFDEHVSPDMQYAEFKQLCSECWKDRYGFITIVKDFDINKGRYRKNFDQYITV